MLTQMATKMVALIVVMVLSICTIAGRLYAQPGDHYIFRLGEIVLGNDMDITDMHYLGTNREGRDEFLAVLVRTSSSTDDPIYFVYFDYGGTPLRLNVRNVITFRPRIVGGIGQPPVPRFARLIYQPDDRSWYLVVHPGFLFRLVPGFYGSYQNSIISDGKYYSIDGNPAFSTFHFGYVQRDGRVSSFLFPAVDGSHLLALDGNGDVLNLWRWNGFYSCERPPCETCGFQNPDSLRLNFNGYGGFSNILGLTPSRRAPDEYVLLMWAYTQDPMEEGSAVARIALNGQVRWAKLYRAIDLPPANWHDIPWWIAEDRSMPGEPDRLVFHSGYQLNPRLWRINRETGTPIWAFTMHPYRLAAYSFSQYSRLGALWVFDYSLLRIDDIGVNVERSGTMQPGGTECWDYGDKFGISGAGGSFLFHADDWNFAVGNCDNGSVFLPGIAFARIDPHRPTRCEHQPDFSFTQSQNICVTDLGFSLFNAGRTVGVFNATADVRSGRIPIEVLCDDSALPNLCQGDTHCDNGVKWTDGDVSPYPNDPWRAPLEAFGDCCVDDGDLLDVLFAFGQSYDYNNDPTQFKPGSGDVNCDGIVDDADLLIVLFNFGNGC